MSAQARYAEALKLAEQAADLLAPIVADGAPDALCEVAVAYVALIEARDSLQLALETFNEKARPVG